MEYFDGQGNFALTYRPANEKEYKTLPYVTLAGSKTWKTAKFSAANITLNQSYWNTSDFTIYLCSKEDFRIRRATLRTLDRQRAGGPVFGCLDQLGKLDHTKMPEIIALPQRENREVSFSGWIVNTQRRSAEGKVELILRDENGEENVIAAPVRTHRDHIVKEFGEEYANAGFNGVLAPASLPAGVYRVFLRITGQAGDKGEMDAYRWVKIVEPARRGKKK